MRLAFQSLAKTKQSNRSEPQQEINVLGQAFGCQLLMKRLPGYLQLFCMALTDSQQLFAIYCKGL